MTKFWHHDKIISSFKVIIFSCVIFCECSSHDVQWNIEHQYDSIDDYFFHFFLLHYESISFENHVQRIWFFHYVKSLIRIISIDCYFELSRICHASSNDQIKTFFSIVIHHQSIFLQTHSNLFNFSTSKIVSLFLSMSCSKKKSCRNDKSES